MIKSFLILISFQILLFSSQQIILVVSDDFNSSKGLLECYENGKKVFKSIEVNIGKNGLGWGLGELELTRNSYEPIKKEGDKKAPAGVFKLISVFGYKEKQNFTMPYIHASKNLICVDDVRSKDYNTIIKSETKSTESFEYMRREDHQYELGIVVQHNEDAIKGRGSCIFMHVQKEKDAPTAGCTAMSLAELQKIISWLDAKKNPILIQIPKSSAEEILRLYPKLSDSKLLQTKSR
ncbi:L,D-transpeptidase family protein [bacterium]|nr:L,D-transpeptidase family protein [bacterium]